MKILFKFFILLNTIIQILTVCPVRPVIPTSSITNGLLITPTSEGISDFPTSTAHLSVTIAVTPDQECTAGSTYNIIAIGVTPPGSSSQEYFTVSINCDTLMFALGGDWYSYSPSVTSFPDGFGSVAFFATFDLDAKTMIWSMQTESRSPINNRQTLTMSDGMSFDENTKFYLCSGKLGASPNACTISEFLLEYRTYESTQGGAEVGHFAGKYPSHAAFYPLIDGPATSLRSYTNSEIQATSGYFGDHPTNPTPGTSPTWDASNSFVTITPGQFLTFPLPSFLPGLVTTSYSFSFAAWVRIRDVSQSTGPVIFSTHLADGTKSGYLLRRPTTGGSLMLTLKANFGSLGDPSPLVALDTWQLVGFTVSARTDLKYSEGLWFSGSTSRRYYQSIQTQVFDFSSLAFLRVGGETDSFGGDISIVRIISSGGGFIRSTDLCSTLSSIELGTADFAMSCSVGNKLSSVDGKCYESCPSGTRSATTEAASLCLPCLFPCLTCDNTQCITCEANYYLYQGVCLDSCPDKTYYAGSTCEDCPTGCNVCESSKCLTCDSNFLLYEGDCLESCPDKTYSTGSACKDCRPHCQECNSMQCFTCETNSLFYEGDCLESCPDKTYSTGSACQDCSKNCKMCDNSKCLTCEANFLLDQGSCLSSCPEKTYSTGSTCESCSTNCKKCNSKKCLACETNYLLDQGSCLDSCPEKTYYTGSKCQNCPTHCQTCVRTGCLACETNYFSYGGDCIESCPAKTYIYETSCLACSDDHCADCDADECKVCDNRYQLDNDQKCVLSSSSSPSSPQSSSPEQVEAGLSGGAIAGIILGGIVTTTIAGGAVYILKFKPARMSRIFPQKSKEDFNLINSSPTSPATAIPPIQTYETERPMLTEV